MDPVIERLNETLDWIEPQLSYLAENDKKRYVMFEWLKSHLLSIKNNDDREFIKNTEHPEI